MKSKIKLFLLSLLFLNFSMGIGLAHAQTSYVNRGAESDIKRFLCAPTDARNAPAGTNPAANDLYRCVNTIYQFAIVIASTVGVLFIVISGYNYMLAGGSEEGKTKAKERIQAVIASLVILMFGYVLLRTLNPDLTQFPTIQPPNVIPTGGAGPGTGGGGTGAACTPINSGIASVASFQNSCFGGNAAKASAIANGESGGQVSRLSTVDVCKDGNSFSMGLFQINIIANGNTIGGACSNPRSFIQVNGSGTQGTCLQTTNGICVKYDCQVTNSTQYNLCKNHILDPGKNIQVACTLSQNGNNWGAWGFNRVCRF